MKKAGIILLQFFLLFCGKAIAQSYDWEQIKQVDPWYTAERPDFTELDNYVKTLGYAADTPEEIAEDGLITLKVKPIGIGKFNFLEGNFFVFNYNCVNSLPAIKNNTVQNHAPAIAATYAVNHSRMEYYIKKGAKVTDAFLIENLETDSDIGNSFSAIVEYCNEKSRNAGLTECYTINADEK